MTHVRTSPPPPWRSYVYDGLNQMTSATVSGTATTFGYDPAGRMVQMGAPRLLHHGARPMADERLSVAAYTNATGGILSRNTYDEYGQPGASNGGLFQYTGQIWLPQAQLYNYKARVYAPQLGRFMQTDPIGYQAGANLYAYVGNDPVNSTDPWGLQGTTNPGDIDSVHPRCPRNAACDLQSTQQILNDLAKNFESYAYRLPDMIVIETKIELFGHFLRIFALFPRLRGTKGGLAPEDCLAAMPELALPLSGLGRKLAALGDRLEAMLRKSCELPLRQGCHTSTALERSSG